MSDLVKEVSFGNFSANFNTIAKKFDNNDATWNIWFNTYKVPAM